MYVIGLTGGVGSGKTAAAHKLAELLQAETLIADELGHLVMEKGTKGYDRIVEAFGTKILDEQGAIKRESLSAIVFADSDALKQLNGIVHPAVREYMQEYIAKRREEKGYIILETAIMFESACDSLCDEVWYVYVPVETRMERLAKKRGYTEEKSRSIMKKQLLEEEYRRRCSQEIRNDGTLLELERRLTACVEGVRTDNKRLLK